MKPYHMVKASDDCLCLAGIHLASGRTEILCITMPPKLMLPEGERDRSKGNDFDIRSGGFLEEHVTSLGVIPGVEKAVASFKDTIGLTLLDIGIERTSKSVSFTCTRAGNSIVALCFSDEVFGTVGTKVGQAMGPMSSRKRLLMLVLEPRPLRTQAGLLDQSGTNDAK